jgi:guanylate kinase
MTGMGNLYVISAPSGAGKTTLVKALVDSVSNVTVSISHTTRPRRPAEIDGINYHFVTEAEFQQMIEHGDFLEYATVFNAFYGTSHTWVEQTLARGLDVILEIDWQGCQQIQNLFPDCISIFILPPSVDDLANRLCTRDQDKAEIIDERLADAKETVSHIYEFDYVVINDDFNHALNDLKTLIQAGRLTQKHQTSKFAKILEQFV